MTGELAARAALPGELRENAYLLPPGLPFERWSEILTTLRQIERSVKWWVGDAILYGEANYGEEASQAFPDAFSGSPYAESTLRAAAWVSSKFPRGTRVDGVSWTHHRAVAELEPGEARALLLEAAGEHLSTRELIARAEERKRAIVVEASGATTCAAELPWVPTVGDLLPEWRSRATAGSRDFAAGYLKALVDTGTESAFLEGRWRD